MWILPTNHCLHQSLSVPVFVESKEDLIELSDLEKSLLWRSKLLSLKIWLQKWKRVFWLPLLFGRTVKHSHRNYFEEKLTLYLQDIHANPSPMLEIAKELKTQGISGPILQEQLTLFGQTSASLRTSEDTLRSDSEKSLVRWNKWVTECIGEYSVRRKRAQAIREKEFLSWQSEKTWPTITVKGNHNRKGLSKTSGDGLSTKVNAWKTPSTQECEGGTMKTLTGDAKYKLRDQVSWATPKANSANSPGIHGQGGQDLQTMVSQNWGIPTTRDYKDGSAESVKNVPENGLLGRMVHSTESQSQDQANLSTNGNPHEQPPANGKLNPAWVAELMGTRFEKIFFVHLETPFIQTQQNLPL